MTGAALSVLVDGGRYLDVLRYVIVPLSRPGLMTIGAFAFTTAWGEYLLALSLITSNDMQVMEGHIIIISTMREDAPSIGHYHTAGNPGRGEIGEGQELNYRAIMRAILATGYAGYLGQEFVPVGDPVVALEEAFQVCNVSL